MKNSFLIVTMAALLSACVTSNDTNSAKAGMMQACSSGNSNLCAASMLAYQTTMQESENQRRAWQRASAYFNSMGAPQARTVNVYSW